MHAWRASPALACSLLPAVAWGYSNWRASSWCSVGFFLVRAPPCRWAVLGHRNGRHQPGAGRPGEQRGSHGADKWGPERQVRHVRGQGTSRPKPPGMRRVQDRMVLRQGVPGACCWTPRACVACREGHPPHAYRDQCLYRVLVVPLPVAAMSPSNHRGMPDAAARLRTGSAATKVPASCWEERAWHRCPWQRASCRVRGRGSRDSTTLTTATGRHT